MVRGDRGSSLAATERGVLRAKPATRLLKQAAGVADLPAVGDWVALFAPPDLDVPLVEAVLERASAITRGDSGRSSDLQVLAANVDTVFVVHPIADGPNLRRTRARIVARLGFRRRAGRRAHEGRPLPRPGGGARGGRRPSRPAPRCSS